MPANESAVDVAITAILDKLRTELAPGAVAIDTFTDVLTVDEEGPYDTEEIDQFPAILLLQNEWRENEEQWFDKVEIDMNGVLALIFSGEIAEANLSVSRKVRRFVADVKKVLADDIEFGGATMDFHVRTVTPYSYEAATGSRIAGANMRINVKVRHARKDPYSPRN